MKDQYFGDINDYRKYGLLRALTDVSGLRLGVCWMLTSADGRADGEFRRYLEAPNRWQGHDPELYCHLLRLMAPGATRSVEHAESWGLIPGAVYHNAVLDDSESLRHEYFSTALSALRSCPVLFFDPDNGIEVSSKRVGTRDSAKYLYWKEVERAYAAGHSLVIYQHFARISRDQFIANLAARLSALDPEPMVDSFRTSNVVFFLAARPEHAHHFDGLHSRLHESWPGQIQAASHSSE